MKVQVIKCSNINFWYNNYIGKSFEVVDDVNNKEGYRLIDDDKIRNKIELWGSLYLKKIDVTVVTREMKLKRILNEERF